VRSTQVWFAGGKQAHVLNQESRAAARKSRDTAAALMGLKFAMHSKHIGAEQNLTQMSIKH